MRIIFLLAFLLIFAQPVNANVWLLVDKATNDVISMSNEDDAQINDNNWEKVILPGELQDYVLSYNPIYYKYKNKKFIVNIEKLSNQALEEEKAIEKVKEKELIDKEIEQMAIKSLKDKGEILKYFKEE